jgi:two-component system, chemotaxis family, protein-glutamate methylesterase/glutaminase
MDEKSVVKDFPIICVGGSAGGLDAYTRLLQNLPSDLGVAIVIVNHLRTVATLLHELLPHHTIMPVELITERLEIQPNHVFVIPEKRDLHILDDEFRLKADIKTQRLARCDYGFSAFINNALGRQTHRYHCIWL